MKNKNALYDEAEIPEETDVRARAFRELLGWGGRMRYAKTDFAKSDPTLKSLNDIVDRIYADKESGSGKVNWVGFRELKGIIRNLAFQLKFRTASEMPVPSIVIYGLLGNDSTEFFEEAAEEFGMNLVRVEAATLCEAAMRGQADGVVPANSSKPLLLVLDSFNALRQQIDVLRNLPLSGSIGTTYFLPLKTIVVLGASDAGVGIVLSGGDLTRFNYVVKLHTHKNGMPIGQEPDGSGRFGDRVSDAPAEIISAAFDVTQELLDQLREMTPPSAWINWATAWQAFFKGDYYTPTLTPFDPNGPQAIMINPRYIERIADNVMVTAVKDWDGNKLVGSEDKKYYEKNYKDATFPYYDKTSDTWEEAPFRSPQDLYLQVNQFHPRYMKIINNSLMKDGYDILKDIEKAYHGTLSVSALCSTRNVLLNADRAMDLTNRELKEAQKVEMIGKAVIMEDMPQELLRLGTAKNAKEEADKICPGWEKRFNSISSLISGNIRVFCDDVNASEREKRKLVRGFCRAIDSKKVQGDREKTAFFESLKAVLSSDPEWSSFFL